jgi:hypothetical protein
MYLSKNPTCVSLLPHPLPPHFSPSSLDGWFHNLHGTHVLVCLTRHTHHTRLQARRVHTSTPASACRKVATWTCTLLPLQRQPRRPGRKRGQASGKLRASFGQMIASTCVLVGNLLGKVHRLPWRRAEGGAIWGIGIQRKGYCRCGMRYGDVTRCMG